MKSKARSVLEHCLLITNSTCWGRVRETGQLCSNVLTERSSSLFNLQAGLLFPGSYLVAFALMYTCSISRVMWRRIPQIHSQKPLCLSMFSKSASCWCHWSRILLWTESLYADVWMQVSHWWCWQYTWEPFSSPPSQPVGWDLGLLKPEVSYVVLGTAGCVSCPIFCCHLVGCRHPAKPLTYLLALCRHLGCGDFSHMALVFIWWNWLLCLTASPGMGPKLFRCFDQISVSCPVLFPALLPPLCNKDCPLLLVWLDLQLWQTSACISHCRELVQLVLALLADVNVHDSANPSNYQVSSQLP